MEDLREDRMLSDLFKQKLENEEITPSPSLSSNLMRRVGMREFLRFNPSRINIWYAGAAAAAGTALTLILTQSPGKQSREIPEPLPVEINKESAENTVNKNLSVPVITITENRQVAKSDNRIVDTEVSVSTDDNKPAAVSSGSNAVQSAEAQKVNTLPTTAVLNDATGKNKLISINRPQSFIEASVAEGCPPLKVSFRSLAGSVDSCSWYFGDAGYSSSKDPVWIFDNAGDYTITLQVFSSGVKSVSSVVINVHPKPLAKFDITPEYAVLPRDEISFHNYSEGAEKYFWNFGDGTTSDLFEPHHNYRKYGDYNVRLNAISEFGCSDSLVIYNAFSSSGNYIEFPNAFIPNPTGPSGGYFSPKSDESSQIFHPVFSGVTDYQLRIFSKRGILIFESNDVNYGWDGYYKGQLCDPGVYIWKVRGNFINNGQFTKVGDITLLKN